MAIITSGLLTALNTAMKKSFEDAYRAAAAESVFRRLATVVPSSSTSNTYGWLGDFPALIEWIGDRTLKDMKAQGYQITNKLYEATVGVPRVAIEDDSHGIYGPLAARMGQAAAEHPDKIIAALISGGPAALCYDGQFFFDVDHPVYPNVDGTGTPVTVANWDNNSGSGTPWYLLATRGALKPFIFQERTKPEFESRTNPSTSDNVFTKDRYEYGVRYRCNGGYGFWQQAYGSRKALDATNFSAARLAMRGFCADGNRPLGIKPDVIVVPPSLQSAAEALFNTPLIGGGNTNPHYKAVEVIVSDWL